MGVGRYFMPHIRPFRSHINICQHGTIIVSLRWHVGCYAGAVLLFWWRVAKLFDGWREISIDTGAERAYIVRMTTHTQEGGTMRRIESVLTVLVIFAAGVLAGMLLMLHSFGRI